MHIKNNENIINRFERDDKILSGKIEDIQTASVDAREGFKKLLNSATHSDYKKTKRDNYVRFQNTLGESLKKFGAFEWFLVGAMTVMPAFFTGYALERNASEQAKTEQTNKSDSGIVLYTALAAILGLIVGGRVSVSFVNNMQQYNRNKFCKKLTARLYDVLKKQNTTELEDFYFDYSVGLNPQLSHVVSTCLIANMSDEDVKQIYRIADKVACRFYQFNKKYEDLDLFAYNKYVNRAMSIIQRNFANNPQLKESIHMIYMGYLPKTFVLQSDCKTK